MSQPMKKLKADLMSRFINYNNNPILKWCLSNMSVKTDENENIRPVKDKSTQRIDGAVSLIDAYVLYCEHELEYTQIIERKEKEGELEENESDIIVNSIDFGDTAIREVLTPLSRMTMLNGEKLTTKAVIEFLKKCPYSRIPIYYQTPDRMIGVLVVKNFLAAYLHDPSVSYLPYVQKPYFVKPNVKIDDLIDGFRENHTQIALVRKDKKIIGMVTTEDVLEELVGNIGENTAPLQEGKK